MLLVVVQTALLLAALAYLAHKVGGLKREVSNLQSRHAKETERLKSALERLRSAPRFDKEAERKLGKTLRKAFDESIWPQIQSLDAIGRILDGKQYLPPTRRAAASPDLLIHIFRTIRADGPRTIVECGSGTSTVAFAMALKAFGQPGHIFSIENDEAYAEQVREQLRDRQLEDAVTLIVAPLVERTYPAMEFPLKWYDIDKSLLPASIDLLFVDGPEGTFQHFSRYPAGPELIPLLSTNGKIILDDAARPDEAAMPEMWKALFPSLEFRQIRTEKGATELFLRGGAVA